MTKAIRTLAIAAAALVAASSLTACAPLLLGGAAVGGAMVVIDRRSSGTQLDDQAIELKGRNRAREVLGERGHVNVTSYNRQVLVTGEVDSDADRAGVEQTIGRIENVRGIVNDLAVMGPTSMTARSNDTILTGKVKATLVDARDVEASAFKVVTERGVVYLLGRVTEAEATRAVELTRRVAGVQKVVRLFETISDAELAALRSGAPKR
jgi:osmotically-inducible protein OsmY